MSQYAEKIKAAFNEFNGKNLDVLDSFYSPEIVFEDPLTRTVGMLELKQYYTHAYKNVISIKFDFQSFISERQSVAGAWEMTLRAKGLNKGQEVKTLGMSHFKFDQKGLVVYHRDYLDIGSMVYEHLPIQGRIIKLYKKMLTGKW